MMLTNCGDRCRGTNEISCPIVCKPLVSRYVPFFLFYKMDTSKTSSIKSLLMQAWRERWSDVLWGINIKNVLPRGVSGDVYDLADCILQQALVGPGPNQLFMSYLTHCLSSQVISYGATFSSVARFDSLHKAQCLQSLLDLVAGMEQRVVCPGNEEECIALCKSTVSITLWLYNCMLYAAAKQEPPYAQVLEKSASSLAFFSQDTFLKALLYIGRCEEKDAYQAVLERQAEAQQKLAGIQGAARETVDAALSLVNRLDEMNRIPSEQSPRKPGAVIGLVANVTVEAILNPCNSADSVADALQLTRKLLNIPGPVFYSEIIRSCVMGLSDSSQQLNNLRWSEFTFLKLPVILDKIGKSDPDLLTGVDMVLSCKSLLNAADEKCSIDCLGLIVSELSKVGVISDAEAQLIRARRQSRHKSDGPKEGPSPAPIMILRAEPTVQNVLGMLDNGCNPEALLSVLTQMLRESKFELIVSAAVGTDKLNVLVQKLININNQNNAFVAEGGETRAVLFDITFLMLCHIAQTFGVDAVVREETKDSVFAQWLPDCLVHPNRYTCPTKFLSKANPDKVELLLHQMLSAGEKNEPLDFRTTHLQWSDLLYDVPAAVKEILKGWQEEVLAMHMVKSIMEQIKSKMCFPAVCTSAWLSCYINTLHCNDQLKPKNVMLIFSLANVDDSSGVLDYYKYAQEMMVSIVKKMMYYHATSSSQKGQKNTSALIEKTPLWTAVEEIFDNVHSGAWIDITTINSLNGILDTVGPVWFCDALIRHALKYQHQDDLNCAIELAYGLFQIDVQLCALALLTNVLPNYLLWESKQDFLTEPKGSALAKLVTLTTFTALTLRPAKGGGAPESRKTYPVWEMRLQESLLNHSKSRNKNRRMNTDLESLEDTPYGLQFHNNEDSLEPLDRAIAELFRLLYAIATEPVISQRSFFPLELFRQFVTCGDPGVASQVLQFLPLGFISQLVRAMPQSLSPSLVLALSSFTTPRTRKVVARAICQLQITQAMT
ncbi:mediator of RNA polymerase II transcription subunit 24-like [Tropilaelaps mercedesae]|uniref:Mediator of RNA polymerase II transcription subunit 24 n=1 Tax=Tropilaelaps mercedesae TaxID=418985 RepID=A0A1V9X6C4_9ACAR|nr:mediator of RNA polymerase II transcription subunit 24-like [Tropilaelaps mercedesae]